MKHSCCGRLYCKVCLAGQASKECNRNLYFVIVMRHGSLHDRNGWNSYAQGLGLAYQPACNSFEFNQEKTVSLAGIRTPGHAFDLGTKSIRHQLSYTGWTNFNILFIKSKVFKWVFMMIWSRSCHQTSFCAVRPNNINQKL